MFEDFGSPTDKIVADKSAENSEHSRARSVVVNSDGYSVEELIPIEDRVEDCVLSLLDTPQKKRSWAMQERFLKAFGRCGTVTGAARTVGISRPIVYHWLEHDYLGFKDRHQLAILEFRDSLEDKAISLVEEMKPGNSPLLLITLLNANLPEKYRSAAVIQDEVIHDTLRELKRLRKKELEPPALIDGLEEPSTEPQNAQTARQASIGAQ